MQYKVDEESINHSMFKKLFVSAPSAPDWYLDYYLKSMLSDLSEIKCVNDCMVMENGECDLVLTYDGRFNAEADWRIKYAHRMTQELIHHGLY